MADYNKGDFTQQGINGDVTALVRLNEKRIARLKLSSDDETSGVTVSGYVYDDLNGEKYPIGGSQPTGTINITENGTYNVSSYRNAEVEVSNTTTVTIPYFYNTVTLEELDGIYTADISLSSPYLLNRQTMMVTINEGERQQYPVYFDSSTGDYRIGDEDTRYIIYGNVLDNFATIVGTEGGTITLRVNGTYTGVRCSMDFSPGTPQAPLILGQNDGGIICGINRLTTSVTKTVVIPYDNQNYLPYISFLTFGGPK